MPRWGCASSSTPDEKSITILTVGIDLAKNAVTVHEVNDAGNAEVVRPSALAPRFHPFIAGLSPCVIGMEACSRSAPWARQFATHGYTVKLLAPTG